MQSVFFNKKTSGPQMAIPFSSNQLLYLHVHRVCMVSPYFMVKIVVSCPFSPKLQGFPADLLLPNPSTGPPGLVLPGRRGAQHPAPCAARGGRRAKPLRGVDGGADGEVQHQHHGDDLIGRMAVVCGGSRDIYRYSGSTTVDG